MICHLWVTIHRRRARAGSQAPKPVPQASIERCARLLARGAAKGKSFVIFAREFKLAILVT